MAKLIIKRLSLKKAEWFKSHLLHEHRKIVKGRIKLTG
jgi:hypothetical protein